VVFVLDLDSTIVGNVGMMVERHNLVKQINNLGKTGAFGDAAAFVPVKHDLARLVTPIIRPGYADFHRAMAAAGAEFFVYTCSTDDWAHTAVAALEEALPGVVFSRPIFTRERGCADLPLEPYMKKSIRAIVPDVHRALRRRYPALTGPEALLNRVVFVDDKAVNTIETEDARQVTCSPYTVSYPFDMATGVPAEILARPEVASAVSAAVLEFYNGQVYYYSDVRAQAVNVGGKLAHVVVHDTSTCVGDDAFWPGLQKTVTAALAKSRGAGLTAAQVAGLAPPVKKHPKPTSD
jgi:hypothetical protein